MSEDQRLLVVDDEEAICEGCRRIFTRQGFAVEKTSDAEVGLQLAEENDYAAILLDIKMPTMTGIEFLEQLRNKRPNVPVILMTGYPSVPNAISAIRLGAAGYVTKPFTPEEISSAVHKHVRGVATESREQAAEAAHDDWAPAAEGVQFWNAAWVQHGQDGTARMGTLTPRSQAAVIRSVRLPQIGETVYQGLPLAAIEREGQPPQIVAAPLSGVVVAVNERLAKQPAALWEDPCGQGWLAAISPTRYDEEIERCSRRRVILLNADVASAHQQQEKLVALGCQVRWAKNWEDLALPLQDQRVGVIVLDAASFGPDGPALVQRINAADPERKIVLVAAGDSSLEAAYRAYRIFYYAVEPFADNEIIDILQAAFRVPVPTPAKKAGDRKATGHIATINLVNRNGSKVRLMAAAGLLKGDEGVGLWIRQRLLDRLLPIETSFGEQVITPTSIAKLAGVCERVIVLLGRDIERLPGSLLRDTKAAYLAVSGAGLENVTTLVVQPVKQEGGLAGLDEATQAVLAEHVVNELTSY